MKNSNILSRAQYILLRSMQTTNLQDIKNHQWPWESERWKELVFAILTRTTKLSEFIVRDVVQDLSDSWLLSIEALAELVNDKNEIDMHQANAISIREILEKSGFTAEEACTALTSISELASSLKSNFNGKIQQYLRHYGELMLSEIGHYFHLSTLSSDDVAFAFTYWLQNVSNMPLSLVDESVKAVCEEAGVSPKEMITAADAIGINVAWMDDLLGRYIKQQAVWKQENSQSFERCLKAS